MGIFEKTFSRLLNEDVTAATAFGAADAGAYGNQFPSQNDKAFNPGDARPMDPYNMILGKKNKKRKKNKKQKLPIQRRTFSGL